MLRPRSSIPRDRPGVVERAYQMARTGQFHYVEEIRRELDREGYYPCRAHIAGAALLKSLRAEITTALGKPSPDRHI
jgi:hypothetical protein